MRRWKGIGLAAPQVAHFEQLIVAEVNGQTLQWANPTIIEREGTERMEEGCLSIPGSFVDVVRSGRVRVRALDIEGQTVERELNGLLARVVQHEIDHLNGVLIIDHGPAMQCQTSIGPSPRRSGYVRAGRFRDGTLSLPMSDSSGGKP